MPLASYNFRATYEPKSAIAKTREWTVPPVDCPEGVLFAVENHGTQIMLDACLNGRR